MSDNREERKKEIIATYYSAYMKDVMKTYKENLLLFKPIPLIMDDIKFYSNEFKSKISWDEIFDKDDPLDEVINVVESFDQYMTEQIQHQIDTIISKNIKIKKGE